MCDLRCEYMRRANIVNEQNWRLVIFAQLSAHWHAFRAWMRVGKQWNGEIKIIIAMNIRWIVFKGKTSTQPASPFLNYGCVYILGQRTAEHYAFGTCSFPFSIELPESRRSIDRWCRASTFRYASHARYTLMDWPAWARCHGALLRSVLHVNLRQIFTLSLRSFVNAGASCRPSAATSFSSTSSPYFCCIFKICHVNFRLHNLSVRRPNECNSFIRRHSDGHP